MEQTRQSNLSFVRRNLKVDSSSLKKKHAYQALVRPKLEYCSSVWDPYTAENNYKLEKVQRRAA
jgi:lipid II:glycine glycyltransferase (peptidoglycan interpeptide bridge formation enzyme)